MPFRAGHHWNMKVKLGFGRPHPTYWQITVGYKQRSFPPLSFYLIEVTSKHFPPFLLALLVFLNWSYYALTASSGQSSPWRQVLSNLALFMNQLIPLNLGVWKKPVLINFQKRYKQISDLLPPIHACSSTIKNTHLKSSFHFPGAFYFVGTCHCCQECEVNKSTFCNF